MNLSRATLLGSASLSLALILMLTGCVHPSAQRAADPIAVERDTDGDLLALALETVGSLRQEVNALLPARAQMAEEITRLQATVDEQHKLILSLNDQRGDLLEKFAHLEARNQTLEQDLLEANDEFTRKLAELSEFQISGQGGGDPSRTFQSLREQNAWLKRKLEELRYRIVREQSDVESLREDLAEIAVGPDGTTLIEDPENREASIDTVPAPTPRGTTPAAPASGTDSQSMLLITMVICLAFVICFALWLRSNAQRPVIAAPVIPAPAPTPSPAPVQAPPPTWQSTEPPSAPPAPSVVEREVTTETAEKPEPTPSPEVTQPLPELALKPLTPNLTQPIDIEELKDTEQITVPRRKSPGPAKPKQKPRKKAPVIEAPATEEIGLTTEPIDTLPDHLAPDTEEIGLTTEPLPTDLVDDGPATEEIGMATEEIGPETPELGLATEMISAGGKAMDAEADADTQLIRSNPNVRSRKKDSADADGDKKGSERDENEKLAQELKGIIHQMLEEST